MTIPLFYSDGYVMTIPLFYSDGDGVWRERRSLGIKSNQWGRDEGNPTHHWKTQSKKSTDP